MDNSSKKWVIIPEKGNNVILQVTHTCGHISRYSYAGKEFAGSGDELAAKMCSACQNEIRVNEFRIKRQREVDAARTEGRVSW